MWMILSGTKQSTVLDILALIRSQLLWLLKLHSCRFVLTLGLDLMHLYATIPSHLPTYWHHFSRYFVRVFSLCSSAAVAHVAKALVHYFLPPRLHMLASRRRKYAY